MPTTKFDPNIAIGHVLGLLRKEAGLTQAQLSAKITLSPATISRVEAGDAEITPDELDTILTTLGTPAAQEFRAYLKQEWILERPPFDHPDRKALWEADAALKRLREVKEDPDIKSVFVRQIDVYEKELIRNADFLYGREHQVAFIGSIGVGKTTAICKLVGLSKPGENKFDRQSVLETGGGRTTICEVHISRGPQYGIRILPKAEEAIRREVEEYAEYLANSVRQDANQAKPATEEEGESPGASEEIARAIRNMADLTTVTREEGGKKIRISRAKELAQQYPNAAELAIQIMTRMDLLRRTKRDAWYPDGDPNPPMQWLQQIFGDVNNGRHPEFTIPHKIEIVVPDPVLGSEDFPIRVVDTKGIDVTAARQDLECHFDDRKTVVVLCSSFNNAPEVPIQTLLQRAKEAGIKDYEPKTVILVLPRPEEALAVKQDDGAKVETEEEGYDRRGEQITMALEQQGVNDVSVLFFNAKENEPEPTRDQLVATVRRFRKMYCDRITKLSQEADWLIRNRENEEVRLVFQDVSRHLNAWIEKNRVLEVEESPVERPLLKAIEGTRHAGTVRAAVRRYGDWYNLDYYHHLAVGARRLAVNLIGSKLEKFKDLVNHLMGSSDYSPAKEFLGRVIDQVDAAAETGYRTAQVAGKEAFETALRKDFPFWSACEKRWGAPRLKPGGKYRDEIRDLTEKQIDEGYETAHELVEKLISDEWTKIVVVLEKMLQEGEGQATPAATR